MKLLSNIMLTTRWILAPMFLGLSAALLLIAVKFFGEIIHVFPQIFEIAESELVLMVLSLIDLALVGSLVVMVMLSGYENFISRFDKNESLDWLHKMDANSLKVKVATSIVAISSIHLLQLFMDAQDVANDKLLWSVIIHLTFVVSAFIMGYMDKLTKSKAV